MAGDIKLISVVDQAIDWKRLGPEKHRQYREQRKLELLSGFELPDKRPIIFQVREIRHRHMQFVDRGTQAERALAAFQFSVQHVENIRTDDDRLLPSVSLERPPGEDSLREEVLEKYFTWRQIQEIGWLAYQRAFLAGLTGYSFQLPDSLLEHWVQEALAGDADANRTSPAPSNDVTSPAATATTSPDSSTSDEHSGSPTPATAAEPSSAAA